MVILLPKYTIEVLADKDMEWFVETACVNMLKYETLREDLVNVDNLYMLASLTAISGTSFVVKVDGVNAGAIGGILSPNLFNPDITTLSELFWYVLPEYREGRVGAMLLNKFLEVGDEQADEISMSLLISSKLKKESLFKKGFVLQEYSFIKRK
jgi:hypothetical protein